MSHDAVPENPETQFAKLVKYAREERGWSQDELARQLKNAGHPIHQTGLARLETGERGIRLNEAAAIAKLLGLDLRSFGALGGIPAIASDIEYQEANELHARLGDRKKELQGELSSLHGTYEDEIARKRAELQNLEISMLQRGQAIEEYVRRRREELRGQ